MLLWLLLDPYDSIIFVAGICNFDFHVRLLLLSFCVACGCAFYSLYPFATDALAFWLLPPIFALFGWIAISYRRPREFTNFNFCWLLITNLRIRARGYWIRKCFNSLVSKYQRLQVCRIFSIQMTSLSVHHGKNSSLEPVLCPFPLSWQPLHLMCFNTVCRICCLPHYSAELDF